MSDLKNRNIDNTHPALLKRLEREEIENRILSYRKKKQFSAVSGAFFLFIGVMVLLNSEIINPYFAIVPGVIALVFGLLCFIYKDRILTEIITRGMLELFYKHHNL